MTTCNKRLFRKKKQNNCLAQTKKLIILSILSTLMDVPYYIIYIIIFSLYNEKIQNKFIQDCLFITSVEEDYPYLIPFILQYVLTLADQPV